jgi:basic amino acid/polyamine antiporter, APA family
VSRQENYASLPVALTHVAAPKPALSLIDAVAIIVGVVIGAGIFKTPALVASNSANESVMLLSWLAGGAISLVGALCYAELATTYPHVGGTYYYLARSFGQNVAFLFAWARMTVVQTGSIALLAFVFGDYASQLLQLGDYSSSLYAAGAIVLLTLINIMGLQQGKWTQNLLSAAKVLGLLLVVFMGLISTVPSAPVPSAASSPPTWGLAMLFVLLSYGGWNEAAYISAEIQNRKRNIVRSLLWSIGLITGIYLLINLAYLRSLGFVGMAQSEAVAADLMRHSFGSLGSVFISVLIAVSTLGAANATIFTGARTNYAVGCDMSRLGFLGRWKEHSGTPTAGLLLQAAIVLLLILLGTVTRKEFETMVDYTAPVFWFFFLLSGISLFILRQKDPQRARPFKVPLYPFTPLLFCAVCGYLLYSSLVYTGVGALVGVGAVALGVPILFGNRS